jgi:hypothetical protein
MKFNLRFNYPDKTPRKVTLGLFLMFLPVGIPCGVIIGAVTRLVAESDIIGIFVGVASTIWIMWFFARNVVGDWS